MKLLGRKNEIGDNRLRLWLIFGQLGHIKLNGVAPLIPDPPDATPPLGKINPFEIHHIAMIDRPGVAGAVLQTPSSFIN